MISSSIETFSPSAASAALMNNDANRPISKNTVAVYASAMKNGEWMLNGEAITFFNDGGLANGQHRLKAVISSGVPLTTLVVRGVDRGAFKTIDGGKRRRVGDVLSIMGEVNANKLGGALRAYSYITSGVSKGRTEFTSAHAVALLEKFPTMRHWTNEFVRSTKARSIFTSSLIAVLAVTAQRHGDDVASAFLDQIDSGVGLESKSPALVLRDRFMNRGVGRKFTSEHELALYIKAMNAHVAKRTLGMLRQGADDAFPTLL